ncbi:hypothetical protein M409DRAFT_25007 [Zasmidium cellare ATCC 36951]|uniref:Uncharacterized protein n=1 Tax=Zasmidium cellare ATCC 36951 TaxID=1080233 RepID=A0A6A6CC55_ZASCE|nr:uncharacterized protein M409DRAFT_25007 [Zasmidium cellare ATCC 36951]KAF2164611.1 hypothetical protein M409DRAFT_25007 [Zasmidium cellare ATCC 36951]
MNTTSPNDMALRMKPVTTKTISSNQATEAPDLSFSKAKPPVTPYSRGPAEDASSHIALVRLLRFFEHWDRNEPFGKWWNNEFTERELELLRMLEDHRHSDHQVLWRMQSLALYEGKFLTAPRPWDHHEMVREFGNNCGCTPQRRIDLAMACFDERLDQATFGWIKLWFAIDDQEAQEISVHMIFPDATPKWMDWGIDCG